MGFLISFLTVLFIILCVLLIIIILLQSNKSAGMGILGGSSQSAFGSSTASVITRATSVMVFLFMLGSLGLAALESYRSSSLEKRIMSGGGAEISAEKDPAGSPPEDE
ncbi:MAG: preprotein translocase subunit SecG [Leptospirales bacterium]|nr:preprotein translocase subunit SecG [Leptospirales bacterium]